MTRTVARAALQKDTALYQLVVVGSSAGGIEALSTLVATLPADFPAPLVLAQHLDPTYPSHLGEILARRSTLPVRTVTDQEPLLPGVVYVVPADRHVEITDHIVRLRTNNDDRQTGPKPSVDRLLTSAARVYGERLIAVILTGTGSDGAAGARAVKAAGGLVLIENPATAAYPGMPESLAPTTVDLVADLARIGPLLADLLTSPSPLALGSSGVGAAPTEAKTEAEREESALQTILGQVRERSGIDFSRYKRPTILRRLQRRLVATGHRQLSDYLRFLAHQPEEYARLVGSFLINVTDFFRDPALFAVLRDEVLPDLIVHARSQGNELRLWSAGCSTGEEAYSLAILVAEALGEELDQFTVQIFATDLDEDAVAFARRGLYSAASLAGVAPDLRARYFNLLDRDLPGPPGGARENRADRYATTYEVKPYVRSLIIFGQHDLGESAPFPRIDLVLCRNVLMYFTPELQQRTLHLFAFALRDGGYLALGKAETAKPLGVYFLAAHAHLKLYRRYGERVLAPVPRMTRAAWSMPRVDALPGNRHRPPGSVRFSPEASVSPTLLPRVSRVTVTDPGTDGMPAAAQRNLAGGAQARSTGEFLGNLLLDSEVGVVVVDQDYDIQTINASARSLLGIYRVAVGNDLTHLTQTVPASSLQRILDAVLHRGEAESRLSLASGGESMPVGAEVLGSEEDSDTSAVVDTVEGEPRHLQITGYPQRHPPPLGLDGRVAAGIESDGALPHVKRVLLLVSDVTEPVRRQQEARSLAAREEAEHQRARTGEAGNLERAYMGKIAEVEQLRAQVGTLLRTDRTLVRANQELAEVNLALRNATDEFLAGREEAEASAEEIKTLNEELQATNEELVTVNEELEATVEELHTANEDLNGRSRELQRLAASLEQQSEASEAARAQLEAILLSMGDALLVVDRNGIPILTNAAYVRLFGSADARIVAEDEKGQPLPPEQQLSYLAVGGGAFRLPFSLRAADGTRRWFEATGEPVHSGSIEHGGVITIRDITDRRLPHQ
jgi:two-component system CheB/CheR fusion protein